MNNCIVLVVKLVVCVILGNVVNALYKVFYAKTHCFSVFYIWDEIAT